MGLVFLQNWLTVRIVTLGFNQKSNQSLVRIGSSYGGWFLPEEYLHLGTNKTVLSLGVGYDVTFDKELSAAEFNVILVDPLADSIAYARRELAPALKCYFENLAVSNINGTEMFFPPKNRDHDSWSSTNVQAAPIDAGRNFNVVTLDYLLKKYQNLILDGILILKMDIKGAEVKIFPQICNASRGVFNFIGAELDFISLIPFLKFGKRVESIILARTILKNLSRSGFKLVHTDNFNFFWEGSAHAKK
jgi:FkbM family methyltransferase